MAEKPPRRTRKKYGTTALSPLTGSTALPYIPPMEIEFDPAKDAANITKHRISLRAAALLLGGLHDVELDNRFDYGEERWIATGEIAGRLFVCAYTMRESTYRVISLRKANRREINAYRKSHQGGR